MKTHRWKAGWMDRNGHSHSKNFQTERGAEGFLKRKKQLGSGSIFHWLPEYNDWRYVRDVAGRSNPARSKRFSASPRGIVKAVRAALRAQRAGKRVRISVRTKR